MIHPSIIQLFTQTGTGNMGDVTDATSICRFALPDAERYHVVTVRMLFTGGSLSADLVLRVDHRLGPNFDFKPETWEATGTGGKAIIEYRVAEDELYHLIFLRDQATGIQDAAVFEWTNPNTQRWAMEVGMINVADLEGGAIRAA